MEKERERAPAGGGAEGERLADADWVTSGAVVTGPRDHDLS